MQVKLETPGAGLPILESTVLKFGFRALTKFKSRDYFACLFQDEADKIMQLVKSVEAKQGKQMTLIKRVRGMEDSSRNWSVYMTLQHLNMVNHGLSEVVKKLCSDSVAGGEEKSLSEIKIEDVKPDPEVGGEVISAFDKINQITMKKVSRIEQLNSSEKHKHPWFGMLDGFQWFALLGIHMGVHRKQIERIITNLKNDESKNDNIS